MDSSVDLYSVLGVSPTASMEDIKVAYRSAAHRFHPDKNPHPGAVGQFRDIAEAYEILSNPVARAQFDQRQKGIDPNEPPYFSLRITPSKRVLPVLAEPQVLYLLIELIPERARVSQHMETRMNLSIVIDRSTSMKGARLDRTKIAAHQLIDQLSNQDHLSVVTFSDRAEVLIPAAQLADKSAAKARISIMQASGGTEMFQGLDAAFKENQRFANKNRVNHIILITDGCTYGDEELCMELADKAAQAGIGISALGIGEEWNDVFLDKFASRTGGTSEYVSSPQAVVRFLNERVRSLGQAYAERIALSLAPDPDVRVESAFRLAPTPQPMSLDSNPIPIGQLQKASTVSSIFQLQLPPYQKPGDRSLIRVDVTADLMRQEIMGYKVIGDSRIEVSNNPPTEEPPVVILDALGKLTLYRMQEKAAEDLAQGNVMEATRRLENLATRLLSAGQEELANAAMAEARRVQQTNMLSEEGHKTLKYGTRLLLAAKAGPPTGNPGANPS